MGGRIAALQKEIARLGDALADPELYARDPRRFGDASAALAAARDELTNVEEQWLTLEIRREELDAERKS